MSNELKLCFIDGDGRYAWFTDQPPCDVWGNDWDELPCQVSPPPHETPGYEWLRVHFQSDLTPPHGPTVEDLNSGMFELSWMSDWNGEAAILPWMRLADFVDTIKKFGGEVFMPFEGF